MNKDVLNKVNEFFKGFDNLLLELDNAANEVSEYDKKLSEMYHKIEGMKFSHVSESHNLLKELQKTLIERREAKGNYRLYQILHEGLKPKVKKYENSVVKVTDQHNKILLEIKERAKKEVKPLKNSEKSLDNKQKTIIFDENTSIADDIEFKIPECEDNFAK